MYGATTVSATALAGTPAEPARPSVATPLPPSASKDVGVAVVAAGELDDPVPAGRAAGDPDGRHRRLGAGRDEPYEIEAVDSCHEGLGEQHLGFGRRAEGRAARAADTIALEDAGSAWPRMEAPHDCT